MWPRMDNTTLHSGQQLYHVAPCSSVNNPTPRDTASGTALEMSWHRPRTADNAAWRSSPSGCECGV